MVRFNLILGQTMEQTEKTVLNRVEPQKPKMFWFQIWNQTICGRPFTKTVYPLLVLTFNLTRVLTKSHRKVYKYHISL